MKLEFPGPLTVAFSFFCLRLLPMPISLPLSEPVKSVKSMDIHLMKSASQNQIRPLTMMMHLGKFSQSSVTTNFPCHISESSDLEFSHECATSTESSTPFHNPFTVTSTSSNLFVGNPVEEATNTAAGGTFRTENGLSFSSLLQKRSSMDAMREIIFRIAMMQPIHIDPEAVKPPKRKNVKISKDPQSVAARHRRERISEKIRILQRLVPGGTKMDTASMLDEAAHYLKFLKKQVQFLEQRANNSCRPLNNAVIPISNHNGNISYELSKLGESMPASACSHGGLYANANAYLRLGLER